MSERLPGDCHICHHTWPEQRICNACGPWCSQCRLSLLHAYNALYIAAVHVVRANRSVEADIEELRAVLQTVDKQRYDRHEEATP